MSELPTTGVYLPPLIARQVGSRVTKLAFPSKPITGQLRLLGTQGKVLGVMSLGKQASKISIQKFDEFDGHGVQARLRKAWWPKATTLHLVPIESFEPFAEPLEVNVEGLKYGEMFHVKQLGESVLLPSTALPLLRKAQSLALEWERAVDEQIEDYRGRLGPQTLTYFLTLPPVAKKLVDELDHFKLRTTRKAGRRDSFVVVQNLSTVLKELAPQLPGDAGRLREAILQADQCCSTILEAIPILKRSFPGLKLPDPIYVLNRLEEDKSAGFLSARPKAERAGQEQVLLNWLGQKEGTPEEYSKPLAWGIVRFGKPQKVELADVDEGSIDPFTLAEFKERNDPQLWFMPLELIRRFDPPRELKRPVGGRRFASSVDLDLDVAKAETLPDPISLRALSAEELLGVAQRVNDLYIKHFKGNSQITVEGVNREAVVNAFVFVNEEFDRRELQFEGADPDLKSEAAALTKAMPDGPGTTASVYPGTEGDLESIRLEDVLAHVGKSIRLHEGVIHVVGSICNVGKTKNDIDVLVSGPIDESLRQVIKYRIGKMFPGEISQRISFTHDPDLGGPFTNHVALYDLVLVPHSEKPQLVEMSGLSKAEDPLMDLPARRGPRRGVLQYHFRGKTLHGDLRFKIDNFLIGWTMLLQKPGIKPPETVAEAKEIAKTFDPDGSRFNKDFLAPEGIRATTKKRQPVAWLHLEGDFIEPGEIGATTNLPGIIVAVPNSFDFVEWGIQEPWFHEYFLAGDSNSKMAGRFLCRLLTGAEQGETDLPFWRCFLSKDYLPSILNRRSVNEKRMPPNGYSWIPTSLEKVVPPEFQYWKERGAKAKEMRDALVGEHFFSANNLKLVGGKIVRVDEERKFYLYLPDGVTKADLMKAPEKGEFVLSYQTWKGQTVVRAGPSREVWHLAFTLGGKVFDFQLQGDPSSGEQTSAIRVPLKGSALFALEGAVEPGKGYEGDVLNKTQATDSHIRILDKGTAAILEETPSLIRFQVQGGKLRGTHVLAAEEPGSTIWLYEQSEGPGEANKADPEMRGEIQVWDPEKMSTEADRTNDRLKLRPPAFVKPQKVAKRRTNQFNTMADVLKHFATPENFKAGIVVEPKYNGFRLGAQGWNDKVLAYAGDEWRDLSEVLPGFSKELEGLGSPFALDGEGMAVNDKGEFVPRRDLAKFMGASPVDDSGFRYMVFNALFLPGSGNLLGEGYLEQKQKLSSFLSKHNSKRIVLVPHKVAHTEAELKQGADWASKQPGSEGAMFKLADSTYSLGGENDGWAKLKVQRLVQAIVCEKDSVANTPGVWIYKMAIGPVADPAKWKETVEVDGKQYTVIGKTANSKVNAKVGDVLAANVLELLYKQDTKGKQALQWLGPPSVEGDSSIDEAPFTTRRVVGMLEREEFKKYAEDLIQKSRILKQDTTEESDDEEEERTVFGEVLVPNIGTTEGPDSQDDTYNRKEVQKACYFFMENAQHWGLMHQGLIDGKVRLLENYCSPVAMKLKGQDGNIRTIPLGTWLIKLRIVDDELWQQIKNGELTGFSIGGTGERIKVE